jgi:hypothetical protein
MRPRFIAMVVVASAAFAACGVSSESRPRDLPLDVVQGLTSPAPAETNASATRFMSLWFVVDGGLVQVDRLTEEAVTPEDKILALEAGPTQPELDVGMRTALTSVVPDVPLVITADAASEPVDIGPEQIAVVLSDEFGSLPSQEQLLALGQVVTTLTGGTVLSVVFVDSDGVSVGVPLPDGRLVNRPVTAKDYRDLRS